MINKIPCLENIRKYDEADIFLSFCFVLQAYICTVALLVELGAKINVQQDTGETALMKVRPTNTSLLCFVFLINQKYHRTKTL